MTFEEAKNLLTEKKQLHLLKYYDELDEIQQNSLLKQIADLDWDLFDALNHIGGETGRGKLAPLGAVEIEEMKAKEASFSETGLDAIRKRKVGCVLLAGGQGTRLGFDKPKGMFNVGITKPIYIFEMLIRNLTKVTDQAGCFVPLFVMTSEKNHQDTVSFFEEMNYFGYPKEYVWFYQQAMAPSVDFDGNILMEAKDRISLSPNGNGGWFSSLVKAGLLEVVHEKGIEWLQIFSVDNVLQRLADPVMLGAMLQKGFTSSAKVVSKANPDERVGVLCLEDGRPSIVEYYEMTDELRNTCLENGALAYRFGVTLNYYFAVKELERILSEKMPVHVVQKKIAHLDEHGNLVKPEEVNGYKFEELAIDMVHLMKDCLPCEVIREEEFAPIKNATGVDSVESARELMIRNGIEL